MPPIAEDSRDLARQSITNLLGNGFQTVSDSRHRSWYAQQLGHWGDFETQVRKVMENNIPWSDNILSYRPSTVNDHECYLHQEQCLCGDEQSTCGRFTNNVLHVVTAIARAHNIPMRLGDFKVSHESKHVPESDGSEKDIPDFVAVECNPLNPDPKADTAEPRLRFVGEAKTPWAHNLPKYVREYQNMTTGAKSADHSLRRTLGQIAQYMHEYRMTYGFLTTYRETIFLKQELKNGTSRLYYSSPINFESTPNNRAGAVSIRECMLYLMWVTSYEEYRISNSFTRSAWVEKKAGALTKKAPATPRKAESELAAHILNQRNPMGIQPFSDPITGRLNLEFDGQQATYKTTLYLNEDDLDIDASNKPFITVNGTKRYVNVPTIRPTGGESKPSLLGSGTSPMIKPTGGGSKLLGTGTPPMIQPSAYPRAKSPSNPYVDPRNPHAKVSSYPYAESSTNPYTQNYPQPKGTGTQGYDTSSQPTTRRPYVSSPAERNAASQRDPKDHMFQKDDRRKDDKGKEERKKDDKKKEDDRKKDKSRKDPKSKDSDKPDKSSRHGRDFDLRSRKK